MSDAVLIVLILVVAAGALIFFLHRNYPERLRSVTGVKLGPGGFSISFEQLAAKAAAKKGGETPKAPADGWSGRSILWVDDRPENNFHEAAMFEALGADVRFARDNAAALAAMQAKSADLLISDIHRGGGDSGLDLPQAVRDAGMALPPLVYYTGRADPAKTAEGHAVTDQPAALIAAVVAAAPAR